MAKKRFRVSVFPVFALVMSLFLGLMVFFGVMFQNVKDRQWEHRKIGLTEALKITEGEGVKVGVIDSDFDLENKEYRRRIIKSMDESGEETPKKFFTGHGTETLGIISEICPKCQFYTASMVDYTDGFFVSSAIDWMVDQGVNIINISMISNNDIEYLQESIDYAWRNGVLIIASAGNENSLKKVFPAANKHVVSVAATDKDDRKTGFSNYGNWVTVSAPGKNIYVRHKNGKRVLASGTSFASPIVTGVAALIRSTKYGANNQAVVQRLCETADKIPMTGLYWKCGRVNAAAAVGK